MKKFFLVNGIFLIHPSVRLIQTSKYIIFKNIVSTKTLKVPIKSKNIIENIQNNEQAINLEKMGFFLKSNNKI